MLYCLRKSAKYSQKFVCVWVKILDIVEIKIHFIMQQYKGGRHLLALFRVGEGTGSIHVCKANLPYLFCLGGHMESKESQL